MRFHKYISEQRKTPTKAGAMAGAKGGDKAMNTNYVRSQLMSELTRGNHAATLDLVGWNRSGRSSRNSYWRSFGTSSPHWYTALSVMPSAAANSATLPKREITDSVFMTQLKHTLLNSVKHTLKNNNYDCAMSTLEERVLETINATGMGDRVIDLASKVGVSKQTIYQWKNGNWIKNMKAENLISLADLAGYDPTWIIKGKGLKEKALTADQIKILEIANRLQGEVKKNWIENGEFLVSITPTGNAVDSEQPKPIELKVTQKRLGKNEGSPRENSGSSRERRKKQTKVIHERRKGPWDYTGDK